jgi:hypothetical protein
LRASKSILAAVGSLYPAMYRSIGASLIVPPGGVVAAVRYVRLSADAGAGSTAVGFS